MKDIVPREKGFEPNDNMVEIQELSCLMVKFCNLKNNKKTVLKLNNNFEFLYTAISQYCAYFAVTWLHDKREAKEGTIEMIHFTTPNCHTAVQCYGQSMIRETAQQ